MYYMINKHFGGIKMAVPRVFISSTYYDLKQVRNNIGDFIKSLGYEPVMHERSGVAYTQSEPLEEDCYHELASCDIVVCIIGNHFGTKSADNNLSITMKELKTALKGKKKIYVFISNDVFIENRTYKLNKGNGSFKSAYTDDIKIHEYIAELTESVKNHLITSFETTDQIISVLKSQFAGLFQNLLAREASLTDAETAYDLHESSEAVKSAIAEFKKEQELFFRKFDNTILASNWTIQMICRHLGMRRATVFAKNVEALDELMDHLGFGISTGNSDDDYRHYVRHIDFMRQDLILKRELFDSDGNLQDIRSKGQLEKYIIWTTEENDDSILPF